MVAGAIINRAMERECCVATDTPPIIREPRPQNLMSKNNIKKNKLKNKQRRGNPLSPAGRKA
jgi:hypothetical protein